MAHLKPPASTSQRQASSLLTKRGATADFTLPTYPNHRTDPLTSALDVFKFKLRTHPHPNACLWKDCPENPNTEHTHLFPFELPSFTSFLSWHKSSCKQYCLWQDCFSLSAHSHKHTTAEQRMTRYRETLIQECEWRVHTVVEGGAKKSAKQKRNEVEMAKEKEREGKEWRPFDDWRNVRLWKEEVRRAVEMDAEKKKERNAREVADLEEKEGRRAESRSQLVALGDHFASLSIAPKQRPKE